MLEDRKYREYMISQGYRLQRTCEGENIWRLCPALTSKRHSETDETDVWKCCSTCKRTCGMNKVDVPGSSRIQAGDSLDSSSIIISGMDKDSSMYCLGSCSRADYGAIASLNKTCRSLVQSGELYRFRKNNGMIEHWIYISCTHLQWEAFDPARGRWMQLPIMPSNEAYLFSDKESVAVGTELLVFGKELMTNIIYRYSLLTNAWTTGMSMIAPRCLFGSASIGEKAIIAGGCDARGYAISSAELYNSETGIWQPLPKMNKPRKMCSAVFMEGKFYVIGGLTGVGHYSKVLTCGEEYNLDTETWTVVPNMSPARVDGPRKNEAPPLVAVVDDELYAADHARMELRKYDKERRDWVTLGRLPEHAGSMNGWGLAFRACGRRLICIGGPRTSGQGFIEVNSWVPSEGGPPEWEMLDQKESLSFVYNCAVMGC